jgi:hypothetical protein
MERMFSYIDFLIDLYIWREDWLVLSSSFSPFIWREYWATSSSSFLHIYGEIWSNIEFLIAPHIRRDMKLHWVPYWSLNVEGILSCIERRMKPYKWREYWVASSSSMGHENDEKYWASIEQTLRFHSNIAMHIHSAVLGEFSRKKLFPIALLFCHSRGSFILLAAPGSPRCFSCAGSACISSAVLCARFLRFLHTWIAVMGKTTTAKNDWINYGKRFHTFPSGAWAAFSEVPARVVSTALLRFCVCMRSSLLFCMQYEMWVALELQI